VCETWSWPRTNAEEKGTWSCNSIPSYTFTAWCWVQNRNFTLTSPSMYWTERYSQSPINSMRNTNNFRGLVHNFHTVYSVHIICLWKCLTRLFTPYTGLHISYTFLCISIKHLFFHSSKVSPHVPVFIILICQSKFSLTPSYSVHLSLFWSYLPPCYLWFPF
jgi:hypothetical protein